MTSASPIRKTARPARFARTREPGLHATIVQRENIREFHITLAPRPGDSLKSLVARLHAFVTAHRARLVRQECFGSEAALASLPRVAAATFGRLDWPVTSVEGHSREHADIAGIHALAVSGTEVETLLEKQAVVGAVFSDGSARHCLLGGVIPALRSAGRDEQTAQVFHRLARYLRDAEMDFTDLARTWLFLDDILDWYDLFNKERRDIFGLYDVFQHCVPASTGIGAPNPHGAALIAGAWAVQPLADSVTVRPVESPLQCSARDYGSCFSRAVEIAAPDLRRLLVSGTASIEPGGRTEHEGDLRRQIARTMEVVEAILSARAMRWTDVTRATAYLKRADYSGAFAEHLARHDLRLPVVELEAAVCRDDLLFEIEVDALAPGPGPAPGEWER